MSEMLDRPNMKRIVSLFAALMILFFSIVGEEAHASVSVCSDSAMSQQHSSENAQSPSFAAAIEMDTSLSAVSPEMHGCHFGHCAYIVLLSPIVSSPTSFRDTDVVEQYPYIQSGFRSETLRPPSRA